MRDLISRADAIKVVRFDTFNTLNADEREMVINRIPSVDDDWIPCSERLPSESDYYLVTNVNAFDEKEVCIIWFAHKVDYGISEWREITDGDTVLAWMPRPKSYKGGDSE